MQDPAKYAAALADLRARCPAANSTWQHRNGGRYWVLTGCVIEATLTPAVVYCGECDRDPDDSPFWVRPLDEFLDGRFTRLTT